MNHWHTLVVFSDVSNISISFLCLGVLKKDIPCGMSITVKVFTCLELPYKSKQYAFYQSVFNIYIYIYIIIIYIYS